MNHTDYHKVKNFICYSAVTKTPGIFDGSLLGGNLTPTTAAWFANMYQSTVAIMEEGIHYMVAYDDDTQQYEWVELTEGIW